MAVPKECFAEVQGCLAEEEVLLGVNPYGVGWLGTPGELLIREK